MSTYIETQLLREQDSLKHARTAYYGLLVSLHYDLSKWLGDPNRTKDGQRSIEKHLDWLTDMRGNIDLLEAHIDELKAELS